MTACNTHQPLGVTEDETAFQKAAARNDTKFMQQSLEAQESQDSGCCCLPLTRKNRQQNINDDAQCSALVQAAKRGAYEAVKFLLERGVNVNTPVAIPFDFEEGSYRTTALMQAAENGHASIVEILLEHDADPNLQTAGDTALMWTAKYGHVACVTALLTGGLRRTSKMKTAGQP